MKVGKSQSAVANKLRLLKHPPQVLEALRKGGFSERHARALLRPRRWSCGWRPWRSWAPRP